MPERRKSYPIFRPKGFGNLEIIKEVIGIEASKIFGKYLDLGYPRSRQSIFGKPYGTYYTCMYVYSDGST